MIISYTKYPIEELSIKASNIDFIAFSALILSEKKQIFDYNNVDPYPYQMLLDKTSVKIEIVSLVDIQIQENELVISGDREHLVQLTDEISGFAENEELGNHLHIEYYEGHYYLSPDAVPLIIERI